jgi:hypothetical protein
MIAVLNSGGRGVRSAAWEGGTPLVSKDPMHVPRRSAAVLVARLMFWTGPRGEDLGLELSEPEPAAFTGTETDRTVLVDKCVNETCIGKKKAWKPWDMKCRKIIRASNDVDLLDD